MTNPILSGPASAAALEDAQGDIDLRHYWRVLNRYKWGVIGLASAITLLAALVVISVKPVYRGSATVLIDESQENVVHIQEVYGADTTAKEYLQTQFEILKSRDLAARVVQQLNIANVHEFDPPKKGFFSMDWRALLPVGHQDNPVPAPDAKFQRLVDRFITHIDVQPVRNTQLVKVNFDSTDPALAQKAANALAQAYIDSQLEARVAMTEQAATWLTERLGALKANLEVSEQKLQAYRDSNGLVDMTGAEGGLMGLNVKQLQDLNDRLIEAKFKLTEISKRYGPKYPDYIQAQFEVSQAEEELRQAKENAMDVTRKEFGLGELQREVQTNQNLYDTFFTRVKEANESLKLETANARIVDPAVQPAIPVKPNKPLIMSLTFGFSIILGIGLAFLLDYLDHTFKGPEDVESRLGVPLLGLLPMAKFKTRVTVAQPMFMSDDQQGFSEAMRTVRTGVVLSGIDNPHKVVVVTSSTPSEGKTTTALNLALAMGQMEKVVLVDADMRRPSVAKACSIPGSSPGLSNVVAGTAQLDDCLHHLADGVIDVLTAGLLPPNPLELVSSKRFAELVAELGQRYDRVVIDSAPTLAVSDALVLSTVANAVIYVVKSDSTPFHSARTGIQRLQRVNAPLTGVVLNQVHLNKASKYGSYYGYYEYYGYRQPD